MKVFCCISQATNEKTFFIYLLTIGIFSFVKYVFKSLATFLSNDLYFEALFSKKNWQGKKQLVNHVIKMLKDKGIYKHMLSTLECGSDFIQVWILMLCVIYCVTVRSSFLILRLMFLIYGIRITVKFEGLFWELKWNNFCHHLRWVSSNNSWKMHNVNKNAWNSFFFFGTEISWYF